MIVMQARTLTVFVFLLLAGAAWSASQQKALSWNDQSTRLYEIYTVPAYNYVNLQPGFSGSFTSTLSIDDSKILSYGSGGSLDGATVCPGVTASLDSSMSASWSAPSFYAYGYLWETCVPGASSASGGNFPVSWSKSAYEAMSQVDICHDSDTLCWGHEGGTFYDKTINTYDNFGVPINDRQGSVAVTCWGTRTPSAITPSGSYPGLSATDSGTSFHNSVSLTSPGSYAISDSYEVKGCAAMLRHPVCAKYQGEEVYSRISAQQSANAPPYYFSLGKSTYNVVVENRQNALSCGLSADVAQPLTVPAGGYAVIPITISNPGQVANYVSGVASDNPALSATPFDSVLCAQNGGDRPSTNPECCANPPSCTATPSNGFGQSQAMNPGGGRTLYVQVVVPPGTPEGTYGASLSFSYGSGQQACNAAAGQALSCGISDVVVNVGAGDRCEVTDGTMPVKPGDSRSFAVQCAHFQGDLGPCTGSDVAWDVTPPGFGILGANDFQAAIVTFPVEGTGDVAASVTGDFSASCAYSGSGQPVTVQGATSCVITPSPASVGYFQITPFSIQCLDEASNPVSCGSVAWTLNGIDGIILNPGPTGASVFTQSGVGTSGTLNAAIGTVSCSADLTVVPPINGTTIAVNPPSANPPFLGNQTFNTSCTANGQPAACTGVGWDPAGFPPVIGTINPTSGPTTIYTATVNDITTQLWACASGMAPVPCNFTTITVGPAPPSSCNVTPPAAGVGLLEVSVFGLQCYNGTGGVVPCDSADWVLQGIDGILFNTGPTGASVVPTSDVGTTGKLNATVGNVSCASNLTVVPPNNTLDIIPPSVSLKLMDNQTFNTSCTTKGVPVPCAGVGWNPTGFPQVIGTINPDSGPTTIYTATVDNVTTALWACAFGITPHSPCNLAHISVGSPFVPPGCPECIPGPGSDYCTIFNEANTGYFRVMCGPPGDLKPCSGGIKWQLNGATLLGTGTRILVYSPIKAQLVAIVGPTNTQSCSIDLGPSLYQCLQVS
jgi:hypothetical protein